MIEPHAEYYRLLVRIDLGALRRNARLLARQVQVPLLFTLKKDAYGHGAFACARVLEEERAAAYFAVYTTGEGIDLRRQGIQTPILVFAVPESADEAADAINHHLTLTVTHPQNIQLVASAAESVKKKAKVHLKVDTGMGRVGYPAEMQSECIESLRASQWLEFEGVYSHLADSEANEEMTERQTGRFQRLIKQMKPRPPICHLANSGGALRTKCRLDMARIGIALYGGSTLYETEPVMSVVCRIAQVRWYEPGDTISYGATFKVDKALRAAVIPGGYGDGILRSLSNKGHVMIRGSLAPILGRVCMDQIVVDVTGIERAEVGDEALFFGSSGGRRFPAWQNAEAAGTISYELTTIIGRLAPRREFID